MTETTIFTARGIHTMDRSRPVAEAVAVRDGIITAVGGIDELTAAGGTVDERFADKVLLPGFVEAHCHSFGGGLWSFPYCGWFDRRAPDGRIWAGCRSIDDVIERLRAAEADLDDSAEPLIAWGLDPIYFDGERMVARHLDMVSATRPIFVMHASLHLATVNTALMEVERIGPDTLMEGVDKDASGNPTGELQEHSAMALAQIGLSRLIGAMMGDQALVDFGMLARNAGVTTLSDLGSMGVANAAVVDRLLAAVERPEFPVRMSAFHNPAFGGTGDLDADAALLVELRERSTDKLRIGHVKFVLDGSIQGFTARLRAPGYLGDRPNGIWLVPPEQVEERLMAFHRAGLTVHAHCNGDETVDVFLDAVENVLEAHPRWDHRHTVQHCQLTTPGQYRRIKALGLCANVFSNHMWYWGDQHADVTVGHDRAGRMNAAATALGAGVPLSMHSDSPVTPIGPLHVAWCAVNRITPSGRVLGPEERISVDEAMCAITLGGAYQLKMDDEIGSISPGKRADFAVLDDDPYTVAPGQLRDIGVWGTVLGGVVQPASVG